MSSRGLRHESWNKPDFSLLERIFRLGSTQPRRISCLCFLLVRLNMLLHSRFRLEWMRSVKKVQSFYFVFVEMNQPILVLNTNVQRESGRKVQEQNIAAAKAVADVIRTCLGPRAMLKMLLDPMGGIVMTNDGNAILREIDVSHPAAKSLIEISRTQDEEVGDGTTSVIILAGELLNVALPFLERKTHPQVLINAYTTALDDMLKYIEKTVAVTIDVNNDEDMLKIIRSSLGTKFMKRWSDLACKMALDVVRTVSINERGKTEIDLKRYAKVEKIPGGEIEESCVLQGVMFEKDVTHPKMRRRIENPRIVLLDCPLEYRKGESQTNIEISKEEDFAKILKLEEEQVEKMCMDIIALKPDLVITEKGVSDLAQHYFVKNNITALRRLRKSDNNRVARACGATIVSRTDELRESDVGTGCGLFEIKKIGDEYFTFITECKSPKACTILLRGASKDVLSEVERNLQDAMNVARNVAIDARLVPGGGATEMALSAFLNENSKSIEGVKQWPYRAVAQALEIIPSTLIQNCGGNAIRVLTALRAKHAVAGNSNFGIDGDLGVVAEMSQLGVWDAYSVKIQTLKSAIETAVLLLRIDDIVSGLKKEGDEAGNPGAQAADENAMEMSAE
ncbi:chaperonin-containing TCP-1 complex gamma chain [Capsaspora owczarzaki ATCC 30864]|uniref:T-complex protein 1 subunit gamma n=2 Tax=Capsaspora owczarzaki (strain ATCC 30864) TaxID=595528 RepID=A0A0D2WQ72_CAPO3|nr:chaperonin-containing TCP-1 complex gamma chain [Capsaspora owczarzaki ATCC 30864]